MIVCIGDSITAGQGVTRGASWPCLLGFIPRARPGDTTRLAMERLAEDLASLEPEAVVIQFGHNDANRWDTDRGLPRVSERAFEANLVEMVVRCRAFGATPYLCSLTPSYRNVQHSRDTAHYNEIVRAVADRLDVPLIDVRPVIGQHLLMADGIHLSAEGHRAYAEVVRQALDALEATA